MSRIAKAAADCKSNRASNNNAASAESASRDASNGGNGKASKTPIYFSWDLAIKINSKQPDVLASVLIYGLYTWKPQSVGRFSYAPTINGEYACYRSTRELEKDYSLPCGKLATDTAMFKALKRASKKLAPGFILKEDFPTAERGKLHYLVSDKLARAYKFDVKKENGLTKFYLEDAIRYKSILAAVLLANMDFQIETFQGALTDEEGYKYGELSPAKLTGKNKDGKIIVPKHREVVGDTIRALKEDGAIIEHPARKGFYRRNTDEVEVGSHEVEVSRHEVEVGRRFAELNCNVLNESMLRRIPKTSDSNTDSNSDRKCLESHSESSLRSDSECELSFLKTSPNGETEITHELIEHKGITFDEILDEDKGQDATCEEIMDELLRNDELVHEQITHELISDNHEFITHEEITHSLMTPDIDGVARHVGCNIGTPAKILLEAIRKAPLDDIYAFHPLTPTSPHAVYEVIDYDKVEFIGYETHYDFLPLDWNTGRPYSRAAEIDYSIKDIKWLLRSYRISYKAPEIEEIKQLFIDHPRLTFDHVRILLQWCEPRVEPLYIGNWSAPKRGHDSLYWGRRVRTFTAFVNYLPDIIKEWYRNEMMEEYPEMLDEEGEQVEVDYSCLPDPFLSIAFADEPLLLKTYQRFQASSVGQRKMRDVFGHLELLIA